MAINDHTTWGFRRSYTIQEVSTLKEDDDDEEEEEGEGEGEEGEGEGENRGNVYNQFNSRMELLAIASQVNLVVFCFPLGLHLKKNQFTKLT